MKKWNDVYRMVKNGDLDASLLKTGCEDLKAARERAAQVMEGFKESFGATEDTMVALCSAPGRTEICGNHTDHQHGRVLAAAVNLDFLACVALNGTSVVHFQSEGWPMTSVDLADLEVKEEEKETTASLIRGVLAKLHKAGYPVAGFDMYVTSTVLPGSGLSSSAACEVLIGTTGNHLFCQDKFDAVEIAKIGQYAENFYFGKKSGLMDQMVCSVGGFVFLDFQNIQNPGIQKIDFDLSKTGYALIITDTKGDHSDLTDDYVAVRTEMDEVAEYFGKKVLREVDENQFWDNLPDIKKKISDRAVLRAIHFFGDNYRAKAETEALKNNRFEDFLTLVNESGDSSMNYLQNLYSCRKPTEQGIPLAIMAGKRILKGNGAVRVHGGGFAGTVQAFVPNDLVNAYRSEMDRIFGQNSCYIMTIRPFGGIEIK